MNIPSRSLLIINSTLPNDSISNSILNVTGVEQTKCLPQHYGLELSLGSCRNAQRKIPRTTTAYPYSTRGQAGAGIVIPLRYQSDDGLCVVDVKGRRRDRAVTDVARSLDISDAAEEIIKRCVDGMQMNSGGSTYGFGKPCFQCIDSRMSSRKSEASGLE